MQLIKLINEFPLAILSDECDKLFSSVATGILGQLNISF
jgi:hypothetical protein